MADLSYYIEQSFAELERRVSNLESDIYEGYIDEYLTEFATDDEGMLKNTAANIGLINKVDSVFDEAYEALLLPFLLWFARKIVESVHKEISYFHYIGVKIAYDDVKWIEKQIGISDGKVLRGSYLHNLGRMGEFRQQFQQYLMNAVNSGVKLNLFFRGAKELTLSKGGKESMFTRFYRKYAYDTIAQTMNRIGYFIAKKRRLTRFLYQGGLVKDSRDFCIERAGKIFDKEDGLKWNDMHWRGKIPNVPFFIQCGGHFCKHHINWLKE